MKKRFFLPFGIATVLVLSGCSKDDDDSSSSADTHALSGVYHMVVSTSDDTKCLGPDSDGDYEKKVLTVHDNSYVYAATGYVTDSTCATPAFSMELELHPCE